jgi:NAD-dependent dihydropyrimidine dehydrogenase PreA subunit
MSKPGIFFNSGFQPVFDPDECVSCKLCIERCPPEVSDPPLLKLTCREGLK